jgi:hypothetical protein
MCLTCVLLLPIGKRIIFHCVHHRLNHLSTTLLPHVFASAIYQDIFIYYYKYYFTVECNFFQTDFYYWSKMKFRFDKLYHTHPSNSRCRFRLGCIRHAPPPFLKKLSIFVVKWDNYFSFNRFLSSNISEAYRVFSANGTAVEPMMPNHRLLVYKICAPCNKILVSIYPTRSVSYCYPRADQNQY